MTRKKLHRGRPPADGTGWTELPGLRSVRGSRGISQRQLARSARVSRSTLSGWEQGRRAEAHVVAALARILECREADLTG